MIEQVYIRNDKVVAVPEDLLSSVPDEQWEDLLYRLAVKRWERDMAAYESAVLTGYTRDNPHPGYKPHPDDFSFVLYDMRVFWWSLMWCKHCDTNIKTADFRLQFCSNSCQEAHRRKQKLQSAANIRAARVVEPVACAHCGEMFQPKRKTAKYCSTRCRVAAHRKNEQK